MTTPVKNQTIAGIGFSENSHSETCAQQAASNALQQLNTDCDIALVFSTSRHNPHDVLKGLKKVFGDKTKIIGGYAIGVITKEATAYGGYQIGILALNTNSFELKTIQKKDFPLHGSKKMGELLAEDLEKLTFKGPPSLLILYDYVHRIGKRFSMNMASPMLESLQSKLNLGPTAGAGMVGDMKCQETFQWFDNQILQHSLMALTFSNGIEMDTLVLHGCEPVSAYLEVTKVNKNVVLELNGKPALEFIDTILGPNSEKSWRDYSFFITLGINEGHRYGPFDSKVYSNHICCGVDQERKGLVMLEEDLHEGSMVQLMRRNLKFDYIKPEINEFLSISDKPIKFALYIDCAGRAASYCGSQIEEADVVREALQDIPFLGIYQGVEIAEVNKKLEPLDFTGVLCVFRESDNYSPGHYRRAENNFISENSFNQTNHDPLKYYQHHSNRLAGKIINVDSQLAAVNNRLIQKEKAFNLLSRLRSLSVLGTNPEKLYLETLKKVNETLGLDYGIVLSHNGISAYEPKYQLGLHLPSGQFILDEKLFENVHVLRANKNTEVTPLISELREKLNLKFFILVQIEHEDSKPSILIQGKNREIAPFYPPFNPSDEDTFSAIAAFLASALHITYSYQKLDEYNQTLEERVETRTQQIKDALNDLNLKNKIIEEKNKEISDSVIYAGSIQSSLLPDSKTLSVFQDYFLIWEPKSTVGGDIYFTFPFDTGTLIAVIDCTGHGVPGALMTMVAASAFKSLVREDHINNPADLLENLDKFVETTLSQNGESAKNGMDLGLIGLSNHEKQLTFSGARFSLFKINQGITEFKGVRRSVGYKTSSRHKFFENTVISPEHSDSFYIWSDGFPDQIGGEQQMPFGKRKLLHLLQENQDLSFEKQKSILLNTFFHYQGNLPRLDDITMLGFKF